MDITHFLKGALNIAGAAMPAVAVAAQIVNEFLPEDKTLNNQTTTGQAVLDAYDSLSESQQQIAGKKFDIQLAEINSTVDKLQAMVSAETATGNTRPFIACLMAWTVFIAVLFMMIVWGKAVWVKDAESLKQLGESWPLMLAILATPTALLRAYFGLRTAEKKARYAAATGQPIADAVGGLMRLFNKKNG